jgi:hypothetical protein
MVSLLGYLEYLRLDYGDVLGPEGNRYLNRMATAPSTCSSASTT